MNRTEYENNTGNYPVIQSNSTIYDALSHSYKVQIPLNRMRLPTDLLNHPNFHTMGDTSSPPSDGVCFPVNRLTSTESIRLGDRSRINGKRKRSNQDGNRFVKRQRRSDNANRYDLESSRPSTETPNVDHDVSSSRSFDDRVFVINAWFGRSDSKSLTNNAQQINPTFFPEKSPTSRTLDHKRDYSNVRDTGSNLDYVDDKQSGKHKETLENRSNFNERNSIDGTIFQFKPITGDTGFTSNEHQIPHDRFFSNLESNDYCGQFSVAVNGKQSNQDNDHIGKSKREGQTNNGYGFESSSLPRSGIVNDEDFKTDLRDDRVICGDRLSVPEDWIERNKEKHYYIANGEQNVNTDFFREMFSALAVRDWKTNCVNEPKHLKDGNLEYRRNIRPRSVCFLEKGAELSITISNQKSNTADKFTEKLVDMFLDDNGTPKTSTSDHLKEAYRRD